MFLLGNDVVWNCVFYAFRYSSYVIPHAFIDIIGIPSILNISIMSEHHKNNDRNDIKEKNI